MSVDISKVKSMLIVFAMDGCPACHDYTPRLIKMVEGFQAHGVPFVFHTDGPIFKGQIPVLVYDGASQDPGVVELANQYAIEGLPTTLLLTRNARPVKIEGAISDEEIYKLLASATYANR